MFSFNRRGIKKAKGRSLRTVLFSLGSTILHPVFKGGSGTMKDFEAAIICASLVLDRSFH